MDAYLTKEGCICVTKGSLREFIIQEFHGEGITRHFGQDKTYSLDIDRFYWPGMKRNVNTIMNKCRICHLNNGNRTNVDLYTPLPILQRP